MMQRERQYAAFAGNQLIHHGTLGEVARRAKERLDGGESGRIAVFDDETGYLIDIDFRGTMEEMISRLADHPMLRQRETEPARRPGPGRPKLGVVSREVSLLPRHWDWLSGQRGGASAALRRLVDDARKGNQGAETNRRMREAIHRFMWDMAGNFSGFEEASRAFFAGDIERFHLAISEWPADIRDHLKLLVARMLAPEAEVGSERTPE